MKAFPWTVRQINKLVKKSSIFKAFQQTLTQIKELVKKQVFLKHSHGQTDK
jgi:hypothetical protein